MKKIFVLGIIALSLITVSLTAFASTIQLPQTGQKTCYDSSGNVINCAGTGQDGEIQAGVARPNQRFIDNTDSTITDQLTGLMWTKDANLPGGTRTWYQALDYVAGMNAGTYQNFGYTDWRLPNFNELESLINESERSPGTWLRNQGFINVLSEDYWSSTTTALNSSRAWFVNMTVGTMTNYDKSSSDYTYVWPVRAGEGGTVNLPRTGQNTRYYSGDDGDLKKGVTWPNPRFTDHGNDTITDNLTGLMWTKNANLPGGTMSWQQAVDYVKTAHVGGYTDWRLPNMKELRSMSNYSQYNPALPLGHPFINVQNAYYFSSTTFPYFPIYAWFIYINVGGTNYINKSDYSYYSYVWPVRAGQVGPTVINLSSFTATPKISKVIIQWSTETEIDNAGFNIYRAESVDGKYVKINNDLIPAEGTSTQGANYEFIDKDVQNRKTYYYKLEDIDFKGKSTIHGPVTAIPRLMYRFRK